MFKLQSEHICRSCNNFFITLVCVKVAIIAVINNRKHDIKTKTGSVAIPS